MSVEHKVAIIIGVTEERFFELYSTINLSFFDILIYRVWRGECMNNAYDFLMKEVQIKYGDTVVAAVSGGPDSMALLHMLARIKKAIDIEVVCAHVNHNTGRPGQLEEQQYVESFCRNNNIIFATITPKIFFLFI